MTQGTSANQVTCALILNIAKIKIKNNTTVMVNNLSSRHKLHGQIENKGNIINIKRARTKSALSSNGKRESISNMNSFNKDTEKRDGQNVESYGKKYQHQDTMDKYLEEWKVVPK
jgi:large exoprotein involved in heme utilization and adhesion